MHKDSKYSILVVVFISSTPAVKAQSTLTNQSIISLVKAGLDKSTILATVNNAPSKFDVSATAIINLKKQGVPAEIINAMIEKSSSGAKATAPQQTKKTLIELPQLNQVYYLNKEGKYIVLDKSVGELKTKLKGLGYGGSETNYQIDGEKATTVFPKTELPTFFINAGEGQSLVLALYKATAKKGKRLAAFSSAKAFGKNNASESVIPFNTSTPQSGIFKIEFAQPLETGEYMFVGKTTTGLTYDVFSFGVE